MGNAVKLLISLFCVLLLAEAAPAGEISLSADVCLKEVINELSESFARENPGVKFVLKYGASGPLAKQIENVAPVDIFIPANLRWMNFLKNKNLVETSSISTLTYNSLVFAGPADKKISRMQDLVRFKKIVIGRPESVAAGEYALAALINSGIYKKLDNQLILAKDSRECLMYAEGGKVDGAFVYRSDALHTKHSIIFFSVPQELYPRVILPMALTVTGAKNKDARVFFNYLQSDYAKAVLKEYGFALK
jgi:molybdate transport system substrate-binding protein